MHASSYMLLFLFAAHPCLAAAPIATSQPTSVTEKPLPRAKVSVNGISIIQRNPLQFEEPGTKIWLLVSVADEKIVTFDVDRSQMATWQDDQNNTLIFKDAPVQHFRSSFQLSDDRHAALIQMKTPSVPSKGSQHMIAKGKLALRTGSEIKSVIEKDVFLKAGTKLATTPSRVRISHAGEDPRFGVDDKKWHVTITGDRWLDNLQSINFADASGRPIPFNQSFSSYGGLLERKKIEIGYAFDEKIEVADIEITYWSDSREIEVPFSIRCGVSFNRQGE